MYLWADLTYKWFKFECHKLPINEAKSTSLNILTGNQSLIHLV